MKNNKRLRPFLAWPLGLLMCTSIGCASLPNLNLPNIGSLSQAVGGSGSQQSGAAGRQSNGRQATADRDGMHLPPITSPQQAHAALANGMSASNAYGDEQLSSVRQANYQVAETPQDFHVDAMDEMQMIHDDAVMQEGHAEMQVDPAYQEGQALSSQEAYQTQSAIGDDAQLAQSQRANRNNLGIGQLRGREFRPRLATASQLLIEHKRQIAVLKAELQVGEEEQRKLNSRIVAQNQTIIELQKQLQQAETMIRQLRQEVAKCQIKNETLNNEKVMIKQNADRALRRIEAELDALLLRSVSKAIDQPEAGK